MAVPSYDQFMLPLLQFAADGKVHNIREAFAYLAEVFQLSEADLSEMLPSGKQTKFFNRVHWARTYLVQARCLASAGRARFQITQRGFDVLAQQPQAITIPFLRQFPEFITTSHFTNEALRYVEKLPNAKVVLVDGEQLTSLMISYNVGVTVERTYTLKRIDENYFSEY